MLVLTRGKDEAIVIGDGIEVVVLEVNLASEVKELLTDAKAELAAAQARVGALDARLVGAPAVSQLEADREQARRGAPGARP